MLDELDPRSVDGRDRESHDPRELDSREPDDVFTRELHLPHGPERERVHGSDQDYSLRGSEVRALATIVAAPEQRPDRRSADHSRAAGNKNQHVIISATRPPLAPAVRIHARPSEASKAG